MMAAPVGERLRHPQGQGGQEYRWGPGPRRLGAAGRAVIRLDANLGFSREDGCRFASFLDPAGIELFEQPCSSADWETNAAVAAVSTVLVMLDESIYGPPPTSSAPPPWRASG